MTEHIEILNNADRIRHILCEVLWACGCTYPVMHDPSYNSITVSLAVPVVNTGKMAEIILSKLQRLRIKRYFYVSVTKLPGIYEASILNFGLYKQYIKDLDELETVLKIQGIL